MADRPPISFPAPSGTGGKPPSQPGEEEPKRRGRPPGSKNKTTQISLSRIEAALGEQFTLIGMAVMAFNEYDGKVIIEGTPRLAKSVSNLCEKNPAIRKNVERLLAGGTYGEVIIAAGLIAVPIMANHNLMPPGIQHMYGRAIPDLEEPSLNGDSGRQDDTNTL